MTHSDAISASSTTEQARRARVVVLGEFSAGKSTLINLFTEGDSLKTQVTATQMPPVWMSYGAGDPYRVDLAGKEHAVDPSDPESISVSDTLYVRTFMQTPLLEHFDLIDTPGNSDPNIASAAWERAAELADIAIWCSPSTQAWRQSELSAWRDVPEAVRARSILLLTRADKLTSDEDREKVLNRVKREAGDLFSHIHMASLLNLENTRDVLKDLVTLADSFGSNGKVGIDAPVTTTAPDADETTTEASMATVSSDEIDQQSDPAPVDSEAMTDDMLIDSLDLSDDISLDELVFSEEDDADMDEVLAALTGTAPVAVAAATSTISDKPKTVKEPKAEAPAPAQTAEGYATALWNEMSATVTPDDPDAYAAAVDLFLEKVDTEVATLREQLNMKVAS